MFHVSPEAKERVLKKRDHQTVIDGKPVTIFLETTKKPVEDPNSSPPSLTQPAETPSSRSPSVTQSLDEALSDEDLGYNSDDTIVQMVSVDKRAVTVAITAPRSPLLTFWSSSLSWALAVS